MKGTLFGGLMVGVFCVSGANAELLHPKSVPGDEATNDVLLHPKSVPGDEATNGVLLHPKSVPGDEAANVVLLHPKSVPGDDATNSVLWHPKSMPGDEATNSVLWHPKSAPGDEATNVELLYHPKSVPGAGAAAGSAIVNTFNPDPNNAYDCCMGSGVGEFIDQYVAVPFTPDKNYVVATMTLAISHTSGTNAVIVSLNADDNGQPGAQIRTTSFTDLPTSDPWNGTCCTTVSFDNVNAPVTAGTRYWIVVKTDGSGDANLTWRNNNIGAQGDYAYTSGGVWMPTSGTLPAFSVEAAEVSIQ